LETSCDWTDTTEESFQKFASGDAHSLFDLERHLLDRITYKTRRSVALAEWRLFMA
jgi:putative transposase